MPKYSQGSIRKKQKYDGSWEWEVHVSVTFGDGTRKSVDRMTGIACAKGGTYPKPVPKNGHRRSIDINDALREILDRRRKELVRHVSAKNIGKLYVFSYGLPETWPDPWYFSRQWSMFSKVYDFRSVEDT